MIFTGNWLSVEKGRTGVFIAMFMTPPPLIMPGEGGETEGLTSRIEDTLKVYRVIDAYNCQFQEIYERSYKGSSKFVILASLVSLRMLTLASSWALVVRYGCTM